MCCPLFAKYIWEVLTYCTYAQCLLNITVIVVQAHLVFHYNLPKTFHAVVIPYSYPYTSLGQGIIATLAELKITHFQYTFWNFIQLCLLKYSFKLTLDIFLQFCSERLSVGMLSIGNQPVYLTGGAFRSLGTRGAWWSPQGDTFGKTMEQMWRQTRH